MQRHCSSCKELKELSKDNFHAKRANRQGFDTICKVCKKARDSQRYKAKRPRILEQKKEYYQRKKRRALSNSR